MNMTIVNKRLAPPSVVELIDDMLRREKKLFLNEDQELVFVMYLDSGGYLITNTDGSAFSCGFRAKDIVRDFQLTEEFLPVKRVAVQKTKPDSMQVDEENFPLALFATTSQGARVFEDYWGDEVLVVGFENGGFAGFHLSGGRAEKHLTVKTLAESFDLVAEWEMVEELELEV